MQEALQAEVPGHIAVIMDGNGRWAQQRSLPRIEGHRASRQSIRDTVQACDDIGVRYLTLYTFSSENWTRPDNEVHALMTLIEYTLRGESVELHRKNVRVRLLGEAAPLPQPLKDEINRVETLTGANTGLTLQLAINYGGRQELVHAMRALAGEVAAGKLAPDDITVENISARLYRPDAPDPDLLIRTGGDFRVSNYLLWQLAYAEIHVTPVLWPDYRKEHLFQAVIEYQHRERRFGGVLDAS